MSSCKYIHTRNNILREIPPGPFCTSFPAKKAAANKNNTQNLLLQNSPMQLCLVILLPLLPLPRILIKQNYPKSVTHTSFVQLTGEKNQITKLVAVCLAPKLVAVCLAPTSTYTPSSSFGHHYNKTAVLLNFVPVNPNHSVHVSSCKYIHTRNNILREIPPGPFCTSFPAKRAAANKNNTQNLLLQNSPMQLCLVILLPPLSSPRILIKQNYPKSVTHTSFVQLTKEKTYTNQCMHCINSNLYSMI